MVDNATRRPRFCRVCGAELQEHHRYCWSCGTLAPEFPATPESDPSTVETRRFPAVATPVRGAEATEMESRPIGSAVPPETGNRTLWIILGIVAVIVLVCCCLLPLILVLVTNADSSLQDEIRRTLGEVVVF